MEQVVRGNHRALPARLLFMLLVEAVALMVLQTATPDLVRHCQLAQPVSGGLQSVEMVD
jgi:hypothetical protein